MREGAPWWSTLPPPKEAVHWIPCGGGKGGVRYASRNEATGRRPREPHWWGSLNLDSLKHREQWKSDRVNWRSSSIQKRGNYRLPRRATLDSHFLMFPLALTLEVKHQKEERGRAYRIEHSCLQTPPTPNTLRATRSRLACLSLEGREDKWF